MSEERDKYLDLFESFLLSKKIELPFEYKASDFKYHVCNGIVAIQEEDKEGFNNALDAIKERKLDTNSPWIYDDILILVFAIGILKFDCPDEWIKSLCLLRISQQSGEEKSFTESIHLILGNSISGLKHIHVLAYDLSGKTGELNNDFIVQSYIEAQDIMRDSSNTLYKIIANASIQPIIKFKGLDDPALRKRRERFIDSFQSRADTVSKWFFWIGFVLLIPCSFYLSLLVIEANQGMEESALKILFNNLITPIISLSSVGFIFFKRTSFIGWIKKIIFKFWSDSSPKDL